MESLPHFSSCIVHMAYGTWLQKTLLPPAHSFQYFQVMEDWSADMKKVVVKDEVHVKEDETLHVWRHCSNFLQNSAWKSDAIWGQEDFQCSSDRICAGLHQCMFLCHPQLHLGYMRSLPFSWLNFCSHYTAGMMCVLHLQSLIWGMHCTIAKCCTIIQTLDSAHNFMRRSLWPSALLDWVPIQHKCLYNKSLADAHVAPVKVSTSSPVPDQTWPQQLCWGEQ